MEKFYKLYVQMREEGLELEDELFDMEFEFASESVSDSDARWVNIEFELKFELLNMSLSLSQCQSLMRGKLILSKSLS